MSDNLMSPGETVCLFQQNRLFCCRKISKMGPAMVNISQYPLSMDVQTAYMILDSAINSNDLKQSLMQTNQKLSLKYLHSRRNETPKNKRGQPYHQLQFSNDLKQTLMQTNQKLSLKYLHPRRNETPKNKSDHETISFCLNNKPPSKPLLTERKENYYFKCTSPTLFELTSTTHNAILITEARCKPIRAKALAKQKARGG
ncbi:hypothetical protein CDAR_442621 [Caerostris darwini]|uniref:Uncharacterized protein n=1 Tax=Caerostris darwini TaxID=1538125 RepID=A0AAV4Q2K0_9ARAC|nr:hypothetical protein CDAR_442621 [Caerostris darwini]